MKQRIEDVGEFLKENGIKPSYQRIKIYEYLVKYYNHPTVDMIYRELVPKIPTLSKTTVYNTLNLFIEKKITAIIVIDENETRYDAGTSVHGHFQCNECARIDDIDIDLSKIEIPIPEHYEVSEQHFYFKGKCSNCN
ncbi:MAG: transcriptional repressor [Candidatus Aminicenantes bacterium]|nr:transcriptional repressor [Candidatus Aminicenantes bacterium]